MTAIAGVHGVLAPHGYPQAQITAAFAEVVSPNGGHRAVVERIHAATGVKHRYLALPLEEYAALDGFGTANDAFIRVGLDLAEQAITGALAKAGLNPAEVDLIVSTSVTGVAAPSLEARLALRMGFRPDVKRIPVFGLGCVAGASGIARLHDYLLGDPDGVAVLVSVELCSLTIQRDDVSMPNVVASGLFGDGAAAVVMVGSNRATTMGLAGPTVLASRSRIYPETERTMGWDVSEKGFRIVLSAGVPEVITTYVGDDVGDFLADHDLKTVDIARWVCHPGGPKVLDAMESALDLHDGQLDVTWRSLAAIGNLSSSSVLHVLADTLSRSAESTPPEPGTPGLLLAMGPGFCAEMVLLQW
ncbi:MAG: type III polyketide synthase [bacterium]|nr:type III polyketide synthase [bacterium]